MTLNFLELKEIHKKFGEITALNNVSLNVSKGEVIFIIGPSGCGKSTLLRTVNWLTPPDKGEVWLEGDIVGSSSSKLTIKESKVQGLGLFSIDKLDENLSIGISHVKDTRFEDGYIRTPLGGFINHSETSNCELYECGDYLKLKTSKLIKAGEELTLTYSLYDPCKNYKCGSDN